MYRVKTNGHYNLCIGDIKVSILATNVDGILVDKEKIDNSKEAQKLIASKLLVLEEAEDKSSVKKKAVKSKQETAVFVSEGIVNSNPSDIFIKSSGNEKKIEIKEVSSKNTESVSVESTPIVVADLGHTPDEEVVEMEPVVLVEPVNETTEEIKEVVSEETKDTAIAKDSQKPVVRRQAGNKRK
ncbi:hypothetical protein D3C75_519580 [compost metagenome]